ncbi:PTS sugar transporter subunit IIA [Alkalicoccobacillus murimartini]|uniref:Mannitol-specific phosphotransferase enzyme IIA component n=1 Tax=Alkalicoccobacillus murimartini TaxID=171685 RepID=A0ABT9YFG5_9BACI|nr:PTS sugar transporter subunit IIA [Alkalicoccobacillus murimartini]MDQ0206586.1 PTS system mannitol-specific IIA component [Alkalicoccobacillus murimartini]
MTNNILKQDNIVVNAQAKSKKEAIDEAGKILSERGYVTAEYVVKMHEREELTSTFMGNMLAIPHGTEEAKTEVKESGISILLYNEAIDWDGNDVRLVIGIAGKGNEHLEILSKIAIACSEEENVEKLLASKTSEEVLQFFSEVNE